MLSPASAAEILARCAPRPSHLISCKDERWKRRCYRVFRNSRKSIPQDSNFSPVNRHHSTQHDLRFKLPHGSFHVGPVLSEIRQFAMVKFARPKPL
jgi:hypothetical protein